MCFAICELHPQSRAGDSYSRMQKLRKAYLLRAKLDCQRGFRFPRILRVKSSRPIFCIFRRLSTSEAAVVRDLSHKSFCLLFRSRKNGTFSTLLHYPLFSEL